MEVGREEFSSMDLYRSQVCAHARSGYACPSATMVVGAGNVDGCQPSPLA